MFSNLVALVIFIAFLLIVWEGIQNKWNWRTMLAALAALASSAAAFIHQHL